MKTNHRRTNKNNYSNGFDYGGQTSRSLMNHGCSPNYSGRDGAIAAIRGRKKKDERSLRHKHNESIRSGVEYEHQINEFGKYKKYKS